MRNIFIVSSLMLFVASCSTPHTSSSGSTKVESGSHIFRSLSEEVSPSLDQDYEKRMQKVPSHIVRSGEYRACLSESVSMCENRAFSQIASTLDDVQACEKFEDTSLITRCKDMVYATQAYTTLDADFCKKLSLGSRECLLIVTVQKAADKEDISLCDIFIPSASESLSGRIVPEYYAEKDRCILGVVERSMTKLDTKIEKSVCESITDTGSSFRCEESFRMIENIRKKMGNPPPLPTLGTGKILTGSRER